MNASVGVLTTPPYQPAHEEYRRRDDEAPKRQERAPQQEVLSATEANQAEGSVNAKEGLGVQAHIRYQSVSVKV